MNFQFADPWLLALLLLLPLLGWAYRNWNLQRRRTIRYSDLDTLAAVNGRWARIKSHLPFALRIFALALLVIALARPRSGVTFEDVTSEGVDIVLTMDVSTSMLAEDLNPGSNRLDVAREVVGDFIGRRRHDRIGLVAFAAKAFTRCPPTLDYRVLASQVERLEIGSIEDGTAIGVALASSVNRLRDSKARSRIIVLLTDGINNRGEIDPLTAAQVAKAKDVKVYTIGVGTRGTARVPVRDQFGRVRYVDQKVEIDEQTLTRISEITGGQYYRATDAAELQRIYREIDSLEKTEIDVREYTRYSELFSLFLLPGLALFALELVLGSTVLKTLP
ncbi:MAG: VWA domain-containing protein [Candidatus Glassbacteria bacterium]|nr:VWA domain-containing protein [Candidatus Glassbacteria bacterium]